MWWPGLTLLLMLLLQEEQTFWEAAVPTFGRYSVEGWYSPGGRLEVQCEEAVLGTEAVWGRPACCPLGRLCCCSMLLCREATFL